MPTDPVQRVAGDSGHITDHNRIHARVSGVVSVKEPPYSAAGDGVTDDSAAIQAAVDAVTAAGGGVLFFPRGTYKTGEIFVDTSNITFLGEGMTVSVITGNPALSYLFRKTGDTVRNGITFEKLGLVVTSGTTPSAMRLNAVTDFTMRDCRIVSAGQWGMVVGLAADTTSTRANKRIRFYNCRFEGPTVTYEQLLIYNAEDILISGCVFSDIGSDDSGGVGIGLFQNIDRATVEDCRFVSGGSTAINHRAIYYTLSCNNLRFSRCFFSGPMYGIWGAGESDLGTFGETYCRDVWIEGCYFNVGAAGAMLRAVDGGGAVSNTFYRCGLGPLVLGVPIVFSATKRTTRRVVVFGNAFIENNQTAQTAALNPCVFVEANEDTTMDLSVVGNTFADPGAPPNQYHFFASDGTTTGVDLDGILLAGNSGQLHGNGRTIVAASTKLTYGSNVHVYGNPGSQMDVVPYAKIDMGYGRILAAFSGTPEGSLAAPVGSLVLRQDGGTTSTIYIKETSTTSTGWVAK